MFYLVLLGLDSTGFYLVFTSFFLFLSGFYLVLPWFTRFYWISMIFSGFNLVLLGFT